jgi:hypothetical protein
MFFQILLDDESCHGRVVKVSADNRVIQEYSVQEAEKAAEIYTSSFALIFS